MGVQTILVASDGTVVVDIPVSVSGLTVRTGEAVVRWQGQDHGVVERASEVEPHESFPVYASGYLAYDRETESMEVLIDEVVGDGVDSVFDFEASRYTLLASIFHFTVPPKTTSLENEELIVRRVVEPPRRAAGLSEARRVLAERRKASPQ